MPRNLRLSTSDRVWNSRISKRRMQCHADLAISASSAHSWPDVLRDNGYVVECAAEDDKYLATPVFSGFVTFAAVELFIDVEVLFDRGLITDVVEGRYTESRDYKHSYHLYILTSGEAGAAADGPAREVLHLIAGI